ESEAVSRSIFIAVHLRSINYFAHERLRLAVACATANAVEPGRENAAGRHRGTEDYSARRAESFPSVFLRASLLPWFVSVREGVAERQSEEGHAHPRVHVEERLVDLRQVPPAHEQMLVRQDDGAHRDAHEEGGAAVEREPRRGEGEDSHHVRRGADHE